MGTVGFATVIAAGRSGPQVAVVCDGSVHLLEEMDAPSSRAVASVDDLLLDWAAWTAWLQKVAQTPIAAPDRAAEVSFCPPLLRSRAVYCAGANYREHLDAMVKGAPEIEKPYLFMSPPTRMAAHGEPIPRPDGCAQLDWEVELALVIGRRAAHVREEDALDYVAGYAVANDVSARDLFLRSDVPFRIDFLLGKGHAGTLPIGPAIVPASFIADPQNLAIRLSLNGEVMQDANTRLMLFSCAQQIAATSRVAPLERGDIILTGTPAGVGAERQLYLKDGDELVCEIERVGRLRNTVARTGGR